MHDTPYKVNLVSRCALIFGFLTAALSARAAEPGMTYVIQPKDTLSQIAHRFYPGHVWHKDGTLRKLLALNSHIKNPDLIRPGNKLFLTPTLNESFPKTDSKSQLDSGERSDSKTDSLGDDTSKPDPTPEPLQKTKVICCCPLPSPTPSIQAAQLPMNTQIQETLEYPFQRISFQPFYDYSAIKGVDKVTRSSAVLASSIHFGTGIQLAQKWSPTFQTFGLMSVGMISFEPPTNSAQTLSSQTRVVSNLGAGMIQTISSDFHLKAAIQLPTLLFSKATASNNLTFDLARIPTAVIGGEGTFLTRGRMRIGMSGELAAIAPASLVLYRAKPGFWAQGTLFATEIFPSASELSAEIGVRYRNQSTDIVAQEELNILFRTTYAFSF